MLKESSRGIKGSYSSQMLAPAGDARFGSVNEVLSWLRHFARFRIESGMIDERRMITPHVVLEFGNHGILGMVVPTANGGPGFSNRDMLAVGLQLGAIDMTLAAFVGVNTALGIYPILKYGSPKQRAWLKPLADGRILAAFALTEDRAGSDPRNISAEARLCEGGNWRISGEKIWVGTAAWSGLITVFARAFDFEGKLLGITAFLLRTDIDGMRQGPETMTLGLRGMVQNRVLLSNVLATPDDVLGHVGSGLEIASDAMQYGRMGLGIIGVGVMKRCAQLMGHYARRRHISGALLSDRLVVQARIAKTLAGATAVARLLDHMADLLDAGESVPPIAYLVAKIVAPELAFDAADDLIQTLGGRGYDEANGAPQLLRDTRILRIFEGPTETMQVYLGTLALFQLDRLMEEAAWIASMDARSDEILGAVETARDLIAELETRNGKSAPRGTIDALALHVGDIVAWSFLESLALIVQSDQSSVCLNLAAYLNGEINDRCRRFDRCVAMVHQGFDLAALFAQVDSLDVEIGLPIERRSWAQLNTDPYFQSEGHAKW